VQEKHSPAEVRTEAGSEETQQFIHAWLKDFMEAGRSRLQADTVRDATQVEVEGLRRENERLKQLVGVRTGRKGLRTVPPGREHPGTS